MDVYPCDCREHANFLSVGHHGWMGQRCGIYIYYVVRSHPELLKPGTLFHHYVEGTPMDMSANRLRHQTKQFASASSLNGQTQVLTTDADIHQKSIHNLEEIKFASNDEFAKENVNQTPELASSRFPQRRFVFPSDTRSPGGYEQ